ncbi:hypothetical protein B0H13DRAFT_2665097 [Mycena leptocephala]|nr:hypothetical protein B0H13DRAFT_2665097 [Mycena leptocephala]
MPDPISLVGLVGSILQLIDTIVKARDYVASLKTAEKDQKGFLAEVDSLAPLLRELQTRMRADKSVGIVQGVQQFEKPLLRLKDIMAEIQEKLRPRQGVAKVVSRAAWPLWEEKEVQKGVDAIERFKALFSMWLAIGLWEAQRKDHTAVVQSLETTAIRQVTANSGILQSIAENGNGVLQSVQSTAAELKQDLSTTLRSLDGVTEQQQKDRILLESIRGTTQKLEEFRNDEQRDTLINWFSPINFFTRQQDIHDTQEPGTGEWFLANESVKAWILGLGTTLWCPGIPGAGKTVLASMVVHHLRKTLNLPGTIGVAALYLNHKEAEHIQSPENLLASIWQQLVFRRPITVKVQELYEEHHEPRTRRSMEDIHQVLSSIVAEYSKVFLIVDALDEYPDGKRRILLGKLADLGPTINLMVTARTHVDVPSVLGNPERLEIQATAEDIRRYVNSQISKSPRLSEHEIQAAPLKF